MLAKLHLTGHIVEEPQAETDDLISFAMQTSMGVGEFTKSIKSTHNILVSAASIFADRLADFKLGKAVFVVADFIETSNKTTILVQPRGCDLGVIDQGVSSC